MACVLEAYVKSSTLSSIHSKSSLRMVMVMRCLGISIVILWCRLFTFMHGNTYKYYDSILTHTKSVVKEVIG